MSDQLNRIEKLLLNMTSKLEHVEKRMATKSDIKSLQDQLDRIEKEQHEDVIGLLKLLSTKANNELSDHGYKIDLLHKDQLNLRTEVEKLKNR